MEQQMLGILKSIQGQLSNMEGKVNNLEAKVDRLDTKVNNLEAKVDRLDTKVNSLDKKVDSLQVQVGENAKILNALEHASQVNKAEHDNMMLSIAQLDGEVKGMREDMTTMEMITSKNWNDIVKLKAAR